MASSTAQINVRIDRDLKGRGDAVLERLGSTPTEAIRALWVTLAEKDGDIREEAPFLFGSGMTEEEREAAKAKVAAFDRGQQLVAKSMRLLEIDGEALPMSAEEYEQARYEFLLEKY